MKKPKNSIEELQNVNRNMIMYSKAKLEKQKKNKEVVDQKAGKCEKFKAGKIHKIARFGVYV